MPRRVSIKICGVTRPADARWLAELDIDFIGINFHPPSPRCVDADTARAIVAELPARIRTVGVFVDRPPEEVRRLAKEVGLSGIQLHGQESAAESEFGSDYFVIKAFRLRGEEALNDVRRFESQWDQVVPDVNREQYLLLDAYHPKEAGGTGHAWDWKWVAQAPPRRPWFLAGGIKPTNVAEAIRACRPYGVDVASGVESAPGIKDQKAVRDFVEAVRAVDVS